MADFKPQNAPAKLSMQDFRSAMDKFGGPAKQCRFAVRFMPTSGSKLMQAASAKNILQDLTYLCESAEFPGRGFDPIDVRYYGVTFERPVSSAYVKQTDFTFICRSDSYERQFFDDWMEIVSPISTFDLNYPKDYMCEIQVFQFSDEAKDKNDSAMKPVYQWTLLKAWPVLINPQNVTWSDSGDIIRLGVRFSYQHWYRPGRDQTGYSGNITLSQ